MDATTILFIGREQFGEGTQIKGPSPTLQRWVSWLGVETRSVEPPPGFEPGTSALPVPIATILISKYFNLMV
jgi:hypothetical protein